MKAVPVGFSGTGEVEGDAFAIGPEIQVARDELRFLIDLE